MFGLGGVIVVIVVAVIVGVGLIGCVGLVCGLCWLLRGVCGKQFGGQSLGLQADIFEAALGGSGKVSIS